MESTIPLIMKNERLGQKTKFTEFLSNALSSAHGLRADEVLFSQALNHPHLPPSWEDKEYREAAMEAEVSNGIAWQIRINREERGWNQHELATRMCTGQSAVSKLEDPTGGDVRLSTLIKAAHAFECALLVRFVPYSVFASATEDVRPDRSLACSYSDDKNQLSTYWLDGYKQTIGCEG